MAWTRTIEVAAGEAYQGPWRMNESDFRYVDAPTVALNSRGVAAVAWVEQARRDVYFQLYGPDGDPRLEAPVNVSRTPDVFSWLPRLALGPRTTPEGAPEEVFVLWQEIVFSGGSHGGEIYFARSADGGRSFSAPINLSNTPAGAGKGRESRHSWHNGSLDLALGPDGTVHAAWTEYEGPLRYSQSTDGGRSFSRPHLVSGGREDAPARGPSLAIAGDGAIHLAWTVGDDRRANIHIARSTDDGRLFSEPHVVLPGAGRADAPKVAVDAGSLLHLVFAERPTFGLRTSRVRYTRSPADAYAFSEAIDLSANGIDGAAGAAFPHLDLDRHGNPYVVWEILAGLGSRPEGLAMTASFDGGRRFHMPAVVPGTRDPDLGFNGSLQGLFMRKLAVNDAGLVAVVNVTFNPGRESRVRLFLGRADSSRPTSAQM